MKKVTLCATFVVVSVLTLNLSTSKYSKTSDITLKSLIAIPKAEAEEGGKWDVFYRDGQHACSPTGNDCCPDWDCA